MSEPTTTAEQDQVARLAARLRLAITRTGRRLRQEAGTDLSPSQASALASIDSHGPLTPSELAQRERVKRPTATRIISRLVEADLIERTSDPADARSALLSASAGGRSVAARMRGRKNAYLAKRLRELEDADLAAVERATEVLERLLEGEKP